MATTISRTWYDTLADDSGSGTDGSIWDKADVDSLLDAVDAILAAAVVFGGSISTSSIVTASGALTVTPTAGSNLNVALSTTGDLRINTDDLCVDTSTGNVGVGTTAPTSALDVNGVIRALAATAPSAGNGMELQFNPSVDTGYLFAYNRGTSTPHKIRIGGAGDAITILGAGNVGIATANPTNGVLEVTGQVYFSADCSALSFTDRTPFYDGDALVELKTVKGKDGKIDHASLPAFARVQRTVDGVVQEERDLGAMISILTKAVQQLQAKVEQLERT